MDSLACLMLPARSILCKVRVPSSWSRVLRRSNASIQNHDFARGGGDLRSKSLAWHVGNGWVPWSKVGYPSPLAASVVVIVRMLQIGGTVINPLAATHAPIVRINVVMDGHTTAGKQMFRRRRDSCCQQSFKAQRIEMSLMFGANFMNDHVAKAKP